MLREFLSRLSGKKAAGGRRLFVAQGPAQLLTCDAVACFVSEKNSKPLENVCAFFGKYAFVKDAGICEATRVVSRSPTWSAAIDLFDMENAMWRNVETDFDAVIREIRSAVGTGIEELYIARNWQATNEIVARAFPEARVFTYGDSLGRIDSIDLPGYRVPEAAYCVIPDILARVDATVTPETMPFHIIPRIFYIQAIERIRAANQASGILDRVDASSAGDAALVLTSNYADAGLISLDEEVRLVMDIIAPMLDGVESVYVKPHPREVGGQAAAVAERIRGETGRKAELFCDSNDGAAYLPLEILINQPLFRRILAPFASYPCVTMPWLFDVPVEVPTGAEVIARTSLTAEEIRHVVTEINNIRRQADKLSAWDGKSILMSEKVENPEIYAHLLDSNPERRWRSELRYVNGILPPVS